MSFYDDASWLLIPEGIEEDIVFAQKPTNGLGDLTFTRASDATRTNSAGVIERTPWNLATWSEMFSDASWVKVATTIGVNTVTAPNGTLTADSLIENTATSLHLAYQGFTSVSGVTYTASFYVSPATRNTCYVRADTSAGTTRAFFTLTGNGSTTSPNATITRDANGFYRCTFRFTEVTGGSRLFAIEAADGTSVNYLGNGQTALYVWGAQLVEGSVSLDYFPTTNRQDVPRIDFRNADGTLSSCGRLLLEPQRTNSIRNSSAIGAVAGTPGTLPTNWTQITIGGLTRTIVGTGTENGLSYVDIRYNGTATGPSTFLGFETVTGITAATGQVWNGSFYLKTIATPAPPNSFRSTIAEYTSLGVYIRDVAIPITPTSNLNRFSQTETLAGGATTARVVNGIAGILTSGAAYDFTIRIAAPQMELGAYATTFIPTTTAAVTRLGDTFLRNNLFTNGILTAAGGTWFFDLNNTAQFGRSNSNFALFLSTIDNGFGGNGFVLYNTGSPSQRLTVAKYVSGGISTLYTLSSDATRFAIKWNGTTADFFENGVKVISATAFTATALQFIGNQSLPVPININQSALFPTPLTDAQCIQLTT